MGIEGRDETTGTAYVFDFDLAKLYIDPATGKHIPYREGVWCVGTVRYASYNSHYERGVWLS